MRPPNFYVGIVLFGHAGDAIASLRDRVSEAFGVPSSYSPPHLTLFYPFETDDPHRLAAALGVLASTRDPFAVSVTGYGAFDASVWYLAPSPDPALSALRRDVRSAVRETVGTEERQTRIASPFHATVAKKYAPAVHPRIGSFLQKEPPPAALTIDHVALFHRPSGVGRWGPIQVFFFRNTQLKRT